LIKIYFIGVIILVTAIILNSLISKANIVGWYDFMNRFLSQGRGIFKSLTLIDFLWLFIAYPFLLGLSYKAGEFLYKSIF